MFYWSRVVNTDQTFNYNRSYMLFIYKIKFKVIEMSALHLLTVYEKINAEK